MGALLLCTCLCLGVVCVMRLLEQHHIPSLSVQQTEQSAAFVG